MSIAILGGTGPEGRGLAARLAVAGETVIIGSRSAGRASEAAQDLAKLVGSLTIEGAANRDAAASAEVVLVSLPWEGIDETLSGLREELAGKIVVDLVVPMAVRDGTFLPAPVEEGSAGEKIAGLLPDSRVVSAFKHQSAKELIEIEHSVEGDVLLCGDDPEAKGVVVKLVRSIPKLRPVDAGPLSVCVSLDAMTPLILNLNRRHKTRASVRILGLRD